ncbi:hypothetical protein KAZ57_03145 [Patescibacteria group bacterium]|nr:hypothetical protein [Patescibacteria group bacterium]
MKKTLKFWLTVIFLGMAALLLLRPPIIKVIGQIPEPMVQALAKAKTVESITAWDAEISVTDFSSQLENYTAINTAVVCKDFAVYADCKLIAQALDQDGFVYKVEIKDIMAIAQNKVPLILGYEQSNSVVFTTLLFTVDMKANYLLIFIYILMLALALVSVALVVIGISDAKKTNNA